MKKNLVLAICTVFFGVAIHAQYTPAPSHQQDSAIKIIPDGHHALFTIGGKLATPNDVKAALLSYPPSAVEFKIAKNNTIPGFIFMGTAALAGGFAGFEFARDSKLANSTLNPDGTFSYTNRSKTLPVVLTSVAIGSAVAAIVCLFKANRHGKHALDLYNQHFQ